jgi:predicted nucleic acid-binding protein
LSRRLVFDTSVYIAILRDGRFAGAFRESYRRDVPRTHMCSVVVQELLAGARTARHRRLAAAIYEPFERARRIVVPTHRVWKDTGRVLATLWNHLPAFRSRLARGLVNDALIALSARSIGAAVVTRNEDDFRLIREVHPFHLEIV